MKPGLSIRLFSILALSSLGGPGRCLGDQSVGPYRCNKVYSTICDDVQDYPEKEIQAALEAAGLIQNRSKTEPSQYAYLSRLPGIPACTSTRVNVAPRLGLATTGSQVLIVNLPGLFEQSTNVELCTKLNGTCDGIARYVDNQFTTACIQNFIEVQMKTYVDKSLAQNTIKIPSSCSCFLSSIYNGVSNNFIGPDGTYQSP